MSWLIELCSIIGVDERSDSDPNPSVTRWSVNHKRRTHVSQQPAETDAKGRASVGCDGGGVSVVNPVGSPQI